MPRRMRGGTTRTGQRAVVRSAPVLGRRRTFYGAVHIAVAAIIAAMPVTRLAIVRCAFNGMEKSGEAGRGRRRYGTGQASAQTWDHESHPPRDPTLSHPITANDRVLRP